MKYITITITIKIFKNIIYILYYIIDMDIDNIQSLIVSMQSQIDIMKQNNLSYISLINDLKQEISNLKENIQYKDTEIEKLNIQINENKKTDVTRMITTSDQEKSLFQKIFSWN